MFLVIRNGPCDMIMPGLGKFKIYKLFRPPTLLLVKISCLWLAVDVKLTFVPDHEDLSVKSYLSITIMLIRDAKVAP